MLKLGGVVIHIPAEISTRLNILLGDEKMVSDKPTEIFSNERIEFLTALSNVLFKLSNVRSMPDVSTFAYWCRKSNLARLRDQGKSHDKFKMGLGLSFHICPSNVPINFAFSLAFGLLAGNTCVLRLPTKESPTIDVLIEAMVKILALPEHANLKKEILIARFQRDEELNKFWLSVADCRIVWGGDETVKHFRSLPSRPRSREVAFPDRYSFCILNPSAINALDNDDLKKFCTNLFNDLYLMDQAACSSPQLVAWIGKDEEVRIAKMKLWPALVEIVAERYNLKAVHAVDKYVDACQIAINNENVISIERSGNLLYRVELASVSMDQDKCRGYFGTIHEVTLQAIRNVTPIVNERYQTLTYFGFMPEEIRTVIASQNLRGIDRVVPVGSAIDMGLVWDGYDIVASLSRDIVFQ
jgi:hypothetical protein